MQHYLQTTRYERIAHIDLSTPCVFPTRKGGGNSRPAREALATHLGLDFSEFDGRKMNVCHQCEHGSTNGYCLNPLHFYIGTIRENRMDTYTDHPEVLEQQIAQVNAIKRSPESYRLQGLKRRCTTPEQRNIIRASGEPTKVLAERYGVSVTTIQRIKRG